MSEVRFIGAGPGDPGLLTLAGRDALETAPSALAPSPFSTSFGHWLAGKDVESPFTMPHEGVVRWIEDRLPRGPVAFLVPGDFANFTPFQSFVAHFGGRARVLPGVGAQAVAAALLKRAFDLPGVAHATILTSPRAFTADGERVRVRDYARPGHTLVLYMNDLPLGELVAELRAGFGRPVPVAVLENLSCPDERVTRGTLDTIEARFAGRDPFGIGSDSPEPTLALVVAGDVLAASEDPSWWNRRYERLWKPRGLR